MSLLYDLAAALWLGGAVWHAVRQYGRRLDDRDVIEAAPVFAGLFVLSTYVGLSVVLHSLGYDVVSLGPGFGVPESALVEWLWERGAHLALMTMTALFLVEYALWQAGRIEHEWRIVGGVDRWT